MNLVSCIVFYFSGQRIYVFSFLNRVQFISDDCNETNKETTKTPVKSNPKSSQRNIEALNDQNNNSINADNNNSNLKLANAGGNNFNENNNNNNTNNNYFGLNPQQQSLIDTKYDDNRFRSVSFSYNSNKASFRYPNTHTPFYPTRKSLSYASARPYPYHLQQQQQQQRRPMHNSIKSSATLPAISNCLNTSSILKNNNFHR